MCGGEDGGADSPKTRVTSVRLALMKKRWILIIDYYNETSLPGVGALELVLLQDLCESKVKWNMSRSLTLLHLWFHRLSVASFCSVTHLLEESENMASLSGVSLSYEMKISSVYISHQMLFAPCRRNEFIWVISRYE